MAETFTPITTSNLSNQSSITTAIDSNFSTVSTLLSDVVSRAGNKPNQMLSPLDMNSNRIINLPAPTSNTEPVRLQDLPPLGGTVNITNNITSGTVNSGTSGTLAYYGSTGTAVSPLTLGTNLSITGTTLNAAGGSGASLSGNNTWTGTNTFNNTVTAYAVQGVGYIAPGVNGVVGNGSTDDTTAIQNIINTYSRVYVAPGTYLIKRTITITLVNYPGVSFRMQGEGLASYFLASSTFTGSAAIEVIGVSNADNDINMSGITIVNQTAGSGAPYGLYVTGGAGSSGFTKDLYQGLYVSGFAFNYLLFNTRLIVWSRCAAWNTDHSNVSTSGEYGWYLYAGTSGFTGDMDFVDCQTVSSSTGTGVVITDQGAASAQARGIRFRSHIFYYGSISLSVGVSGSSSHAGDIWLNPGCQFEGGPGGSGVAIDLAATASGSSVGDIHVRGCYMSGNGYATHVQAFVSSSGNLFNIFVQDNFLANPNNASINIKGTNGSCLGVVITDNLIYGQNNSGGDVIYLENITNCTCSCNTGTQNISTPGAFIYFAGTTASDWLTATGNNSGGASSAVTNATSAGHTNIANNI